MSKEEKLNELTKVAAYRAAQAFSLFEDEPERVRDKAYQVIFQRFQRMLGHSTHQETIDGEGLVTVVPESDK